MVFVKAWNTGRKLVPTTMNTNSQGITSQGMVELISISRNLYRLKPLRLRRHERNGMLHGKIESLASTCMESNLALKGTTAIELKARRNQSTAEDIYHV